MCELPLWSPAGQISTCRGRLQKTNAKVSILLAESQSYMRKRCTIFQGERLCLSSRVGRQTSRQPPQPRWHQEGKPALEVPRLTQPSVACALVCRGFGTAPKQIAFVPLLELSTILLPFGCKSFGEATWCLGCGSHPKGTRGTTGPDGLAQGANLVNQTFRTADVTKAFG